MAPTIIIMNCHFYLFNYNNNENNNNISCNIKVPFHGRYYCTLGRLLFKLLDTEYKKPCLKTCMKTYRLTEQKLKNSFIKMYTQT